MDLHAAEYYSTHVNAGLHGNFHQVIPLHTAHLPWEKVVSLVPAISRGWYELAGLPVQDRIEFTRDYWLAKLPYHADLSDQISAFFSRLDDIGIFLTQQKAKAPFSAQLVYSLADNGGFFHGELPADDAAINALQALFPDTLFPGDYMAFLRIHNGFAKLTDTGILPSTRIQESCAAFQKMHEAESEPVLTADGALVNPEALIPFYESFGMPFFQCFWKEWYPDQEMGNVYYSALTRTVSYCKNKDECIETMAFPTFIDWLLFYLEKVD